MGREFIMPGTIVSGQNALEDAKGHLKKLGSKALIVTDEVMVKLKNTDAVVKALEDIGVSCCIFSGISGEPTDAMITEGLTVYDEEHCDFLIALGGGSPIDSMKAIAALSANGGSISDYMGKTIEGTLPPMAAIPTTAGTGSEATSSPSLRIPKRTLRCC